MRALDDISSAGVRAERQARDLIDEMMTIERNIQAAESRWNALSDAATDVVAAYELQDFEALKARMDRLSSALTVAP